MNTKLLSDDRYIKLLRSESKARLQKARGNKTRFTIQIGHCSQSVKSRELLNTVSKDIPDNAYIVIAGCDGACFEAPKLIITLPSSEQKTLTDVSLDFRNWSSPNVSSDHSNSDFISKQKRIILKGCGEIDACSIDDYLVNEGYVGLARALQMQPEEVISDIEDAGLRGRGGAYFPAAVKWKGARSVAQEPRFLVINSEEGEPGVFKDRHIMEGVPHRVLEGAIIASYASNISQAYLYINAEADLSADRMAVAIKQAYEYGILGQNILGSDFALDIEIRRGAGGYVCGEETTLINTMEGERREPRLKPPFPTESGFRARPTVINNPETLANIPFIMVEGPSEFMRIGTHDYPGTKIVSLSGSIQRPGVIEVPMGTTLRSIIYNLGNGTPVGQTLAALAVGGPSSGILPVSMLDTPIKGGFLHEAGVMLGAGGIIVLDDRIRIIDALRKLAVYNAKESCGKCTPCREGTPRIVEGIEQIDSGVVSTANLNDLKHLANIINASSLCGLGQAAGNPIISTLHFFRNELTATKGGQP